MILYYIITGIGMIAMFYCIIMNWRDERKMKKIIEEYKKRDLNEWDMRFYYNSNYIWSTHNSCLLWA